MTTHLPSDRYSDGSDIAAIVAALETDARDAEKIAADSVVRAREVLAFWRGRRLRDDSRDLAEKILASLEPFAALLEKPPEARSPEEENELRALELALATMGVFPDSVPESGKADEYVARVREAIANLTSTAEIFQFPLTRRRS